MPTSHAVTALFLSLRGQLASMVSKIVPQREIDDVIQETYLRLCQLDDPDNREYSRAFLMKIARNLALDHIKRAEYQYATEPVDEDIQPAYKDSEKDEIYEHYITQRRLAHFCEAIQQLPERCREAYVLKKVYGYSQKEIARELNISEKTVEKHVATGIRKCFMYMELLDQPQPSKRPNHCETVR